LPVDNCDFINIDEKDAIKNNKILSKKIDDFIEKIKIMKAKLIKESLLNEDVEYENAFDRIEGLINTNDLLTLKETIHSIIEDLESDIDLDDIKDYLCNIVNIEINNERKETQEDEIEEIGRYHTRDEVEESVNEAKSKKK
jgi:hypothetical protein